MTENVLVLLVPFKLLLIVAFATLYVIGGRENKWVRRFGGGTLLISGVLGLSMLSGTFNWLLLGALPLVYVGLTFGYGADKLVNKIFKRTIYGLMLTLPALLISMVTGKLMLGIFQMVIGVFASIYLGATNPTDAVDEEALIATMSVVCYPFLV